MLWEPEGASQKRRRGRGMKTCTTSLIYMILQRETCAIPDHCSRILISAGSETLQVRRDLRVSPRSGWVSPEAGPGYSKLSHKHNLLKLVKGYQIRAGEWQQMSLTQCSPLTSRSWNSFSVQVEGRCFGEHLPFLHHPILQPWGKGSWGKQILCNCEKTNA